MQPHVDGLLADFCLVMYGHGVASFRLSLALMTGCIPVILQVRSALKF